jgi:glutamyl-tRNA synthetase
MGINHVIRGEDRVTNTGPQIQISAALAGAADLPAFGHHNLLTSASGEGLSKRSGALSLAGLREAGIEALAVVAPACLTNSFELIRAVVARIGAAGWMFRIFSRRVTKFDVSELFVLSARAMAFNDVRSRPSVVGVSDADGEAFWLAVLGNLSVFTDVGDWINVVFGKIEPIIEDAGLAMAARHLLPPEPWGEATFERRAAALKRDTRRRVRAFFFPQHYRPRKWPRTSGALPLIGSVRASARLCGSCA